MNRSVASGNTGLCIRSSLEIDMNSARFSNRSSAKARVVAAALAALVGSSLVLAKVHFRDELTRLAANHDAVVLPVVEVVGERTIEVAVARHSR